MSSRLVNGLRLSRQLTPSSFLSRARHLPSSFRTITTTHSLDPSTYALASSHPSSPTGSLVAAKARELFSCLEMEVEDTSRPWSHYVDLVNYMGLETLPLEVHQRVLRKCVPPARDIRAVTKRERRTRYYPDTPHMYEKRFQTVMKNIRSAGFQADLDDYHFILEQFAAVGHYTGSRGVLQEMAFVGVQPSATTYRLCLQALAFRVALPCSEERRPTLIAQTTKMAREVIRDMQSRDLPLEAVDTDLAIRIFREIVDEEGFADLIKFSYGIDLAYPDRLPLEVVERPSTSNAETSEELDPLLHRLQPLSTPALNVVIDMLGRTGQISKMVQAFEVLTQPLPKPYQSSPSHLDEDEDDFSFNPPSVLEPIYPLPSAPPNTTTFQLLIKHASKAGHVVFARHYLVYALRMDQDESARIRRDLCAMTVHQIAPPRIAVNRNMFLPVFGLSNRGGLVELKHWTLRMIKRVIRRRRYELSWYTWKSKWYTWKKRSYAWQKKRDPKYGQETTTPVSPGVFDIPLSTDPSSDGDVFRGVSESTSSASSLPKTPVVSPAGISAAACTVSPSVPNSPPAPSTPLSDADLSILDLHLGSDRLYSTSSPGIFNVDTHIPHLQRDIQQLKALESVVATTLERLIDRTKERLGRRVWSGKDIWLADERARVPVTKEFWMGIVNFADLKEMKLRGQSQTQKMSYP